MMYNISTKIDQQKYENFVLTIQDQLWGNLQLIQRSKKPKKLALVWSQFEVHINSLYIYMCSYFLDQKKRMDNVLYKLKPLKNYILFVEFAILYLTCFCFRIQPLRYSWSLFLKGNGTRINRKYNREAHKNQTRIHQEMMFFLLGVFF